MVRKDGPFELLQLPMLPSKIKISFDTNFVFHAASRYTGLFFNLVQAIVKKLVLRDLRVFYYNYITKLNDIAIQSWLAGKSILFFFLGLLIAILVVF